MTAAALALRVRAPRRASATCRRWSSPRTRAPSSSPSPCGGRRGSSARSAGPSALQCVVGARHPARHGRGEVGCRPPRRAAHRARHVQGHPAPRRGPRRRRGAGAAHRGQRRGGARDHHDRQREHHRPARPRSARARPGHPRAARARARGRRPAARASTARSCARPAPARRASTSTRSTTAASSASRASSSTASAPRCGPRARDEQEGEEGEARAAPRDGAIRVERASARERLDPPPAGPRRHRRPRDLRAAVACAPELPAFDAVARGLAAGIAAHFLAWFAGVLVWRHLIVGEIAARREALLAARAEREAAIERAGAAVAAANGA